jgi:hypothetical protein
MFDLQLLPLLLVPQLPLLHLVVHQQVCPILPT